MIEPFNPPKPRIDAERMSEIIQACDNAQHGHIRMDGVITSCELLTLISCLRRAENACKAAWNMIEIHHMKAEGCTACDNAIKMVGEVVAEGKNA